MLLEYTKNPEFTSLEKRSQKAKMENNLFSFQELSLWQ